MHNPSQSVTRTSRHLQNVPRSRPSVAHIATLILACATRPTLVVARRGPPNAVTRVRVAHAQNMSHTPSAPISTSCTCTHTCDAPRIIRRSSCCVGLESSPLGSCRARTAAAKSRTPGECPRYVALVA
ncbi:hypothetical protein EV121DRAFT_298056 [Schizophyllum commune]